MKRRFLARAAAALMVGGLLPALAQAGYSEGMECFKNKDYDCVIKEFLIEVQAHPDYDFGWQMIGLSYLAKQDYGKAVENLNKAIAINDKKMAYHLNKAKAYTDQKQFDKVVETLAGKEGLAGNASETYGFNYQLGTAYHQRKKYGESIPYLEKAVAVKPDFSSLYMLGISYDQTGNADKALATLKESLKQKPNDSDVLEQLANIYLGMAGREKVKGRKDQFYAEAVSYGEQAAQTAPRDPEKQNILARAYLGADRYDQAEATFKKVLEMKPNYCYAQTNLGMTYIGKKDWTRATSSLEKAVKCDPKSGVAWQSLGFAQEKLYKNLPTEAAKEAQLRKAMESFQKAATLGSSVQADIARVQQNIDIARQNQRIAQSNIATMETNLANLRKGLGDAEEALAQANKQRQFFRDKGSWTDEQEASYQKDVTDIERTMDDLRRRITDQEKELEEARAAQNPT